MYTIFILSFLNQLQRSSNIVNPFIVNSTSSIRLICTYIFFSGFHCNELPDKVNGNLLKGVKILTYRYIEQTSET